MFARASPSSLLTLNCIVHSYCGISWATFDASASIVVAFEFSSILCSRASIWALEWMQMRALGLDECATYRRLLHLFVMGVEYMAGQGKIRSQANDGLMGPSGGGRWMECRFGFCKKFPRHSSDQPILYRCNQKFLFHIHRVITSALSFISQVNY